MLLLVAVLLVLVASLIHDLHLVQLEIQKDTLIPKTKVKALRGCKFGYLGQMYVFKEGEERDIDVPADKISTNSFEILSTVEENKKVKEEKKVINEDDE